MTKLLINMLLCFSLQAVGQNGVLFQYDQAGNQIIRNWCSGCRNASNTGELTKEIAKLQETDFKKFHPEDEFSYYPNPVKEELFLKWPDNSVVKVKNINVFNATGQLVKQFINLESENSKNIPFGNFPVSNYIILLEYTNGDQKSINILKQ